MITGISPRLNELPAPLGSVKRRCPDIRKINKFTGFKPVISLEDGIRVVYEWYSTNAQR